MSICNKMGDACNKLMVWRSWNKVTIMMHVSQRLDSCEYKSRDGVWLTGLGHHAIDQKVTGSSPAVSRVMSPIGPLHKAFNINCS